MAEASIPVDLFNPGQVFACLGLAEASNVLLGDAEAAFDWSDPSGIRFRVRARGERSPVEAVLDFLAQAEAVAKLPADSRNTEAWKDAWGDLSLHAPGDPYPFPDPASPATAVCALRAGTIEIPIEHWGDATSRDNVKFWAGAGGYPGAALARDALSLIRDKAMAAVDDPFALGVPQSSSFRFDWRRDYIPIDTGFSLNAHGNIESVGYPLVELLAAIGLSHARPLRVSKLEYVYGVAGRASTRELWLPCSLLRAGLGVASLPFPSRRFRMFLGWPGKEGQARAITTVTEEPCR